MAQTLKDSIRERILMAAAEEFAHAGYGRAKMASIAARAELSAGNLYRYYKGREALFHALMTEDFAAEFLAVVDRRVASLIRTDRLERPDPQAEEDGQALLAFWIEHRLRVVTLLDGTEGSRFEGFRDRFVNALVTPTVASLESSRGQPLSPIAHATLRRIFEGTAHMVVAILREHDGEEDIRHAFAAFWSYQLAGLAGFQAQCLGDASSS